ncbi:hypothetical protein AB0J42_05735 [Nonomuraea sp. NPDC049649]|uniref:hypothetical protein n=1 Tax=Nonomuraea sp. NPDC049649 TaxID=3155776 RepID=UPI00344588B4
MARDDNDRPYDDGQAGPVNPDLTGDVLSPRWSTDDTDEQPAIQVSGNETYILPPDNGTSGDPYQGESAFQESVYPETGSFAAPAYSDALSDSYGDQPDPRTQRADADTPAYDSPRHLDAEASVYDSPRHADAQADGYAGDEPSDPRHTGEEAYLPLDRGYEVQEEEPRRGFLGSGWTDTSSDDEYGHGDGEVRRRTRLLLAAAAAVVVLGVGAGWMLTGTSSDDPCANGRCASVGDLNTPAVQDEPEDEAPVEEATDTATPEPTVTEAETPTTAPTTQARVRPTRTATVEPEPDPDPEPQPTRTRTRAPEPDPEPTAKATRAPANDMKHVQPTSEPEPRQTEDDTPRDPAGDPAPPDPEPEPEPQETRRGIFDILFPWA